MPRICVFISLVTLCHSISSLPLLLRLLYISFSLLFAIALLPCCQIRPGQTNCLRSLEHLLLLLLPHLSFSKSFTPSLALHQSPHGALCASFCKVFSSSRCDLAAFAQVLIRRLALSAMNSLTANKARDTRWCN